MGGWRLDGSTFGEEAMNIRPRCTRRIQVGRTEKRISESLPPSSGSSSTAIKGTAIGSQGLNFDYARGIKHLTRFSRDKRAFGLVLAFLSCCCCGQGSYRTTDDPTTRASAEPSPTQSVEVQAYIPDQFGQPIGDFVKTYTDEDRLSYLDYEITKSRRVARTESQKGSTEIEYAVLRRKGKVVAQFDSSLDRLTKVRFGLFAFLGHNDRQLVIEQTSEKFWRYWLVSLEPDFRVIYDSGKYDLVYELRVIDIDGDGYSEIVQNLGSFWYFDSLDNLYSPRPPIIFTYDSSVSTYLPANMHFEHVALK